MELTVSCAIFLTFSLYDGVFDKMLSILQDIVLDLNNVMHNQLGETMY